MSLRKRRNINIPILMTTGVLGGGLTVSQAFLNRLANTYGVLAYPLNEASGAVFSGNGLPDGVITGTPTQYQASTNVPKSPVGLEIDHNVDVYITGALFDGLVGNKVWGGMCYVDGVVDASGGQINLGRLISKVGEYDITLTPSVRRVVAGRALTGGTSSATSASYTFPLRRPFLLIARYDATTRVVSVFVDGVKVASGSVIATGDEASSTADIYFGNNAGILYFIDGIVSLAIPPQNVTLSDKQIFDIAVELGLAQYSDNRIKSTLTGMDNAAVITALQEFGGTNTKTIIDDSYLRVGYVSAVAGVTISSASNYFGTVTPTAGEAYRVVLRARTNATGSGVVGLRVNISGSYTPTQALTDEWADYEFVFVTNGGWYVNFSNFAAGMQVDIDSFVAYKLDPTATIDLPYGPDLFDNGAGTFASGTYAWTVFGTNTKANVSNALEVTFVDNAAGAYNLLRASNDLSADLQVGTTYQLDAYVWVNTGSVTVAINEETVGNVATQAVTSTIPTKVTLQLTKTSNNFYILFSGMGAGEKVYITNMTLREVVYHAPNNTVLPALTGTAQLGEVLTIVPGTWTYSPTSLAYQINRDGSPISGATDPDTYTPVEADVGSVLTVTETATNATGSTSATSAATATVTDGLGPYDGITTAAAYSLRKLYSDYAGDAVLLRRSSDNAELAFGFDGSGDLDTAAITTWLSGADAYVKTWYDQSGNGVDVSQTNTTYQRQLILSATNGLPTIRGTAGRISRAPVTLFSGDSATVFAVIAPGSANGSVINKGTGGTQYRLSVGVDATNNELDVTLSDGTTASSFSTDTDSFDFSQMGIVTLLINGTNWAAYENGVSVDSGTTVNTLSDGATTLSLLANWYSDTAASYDGDVNDILFYDGVMSDADIDTIGASLADSLGLTWTNFT